MKLPLAILLVSGLLGWITPASACSQISRAQAREMQVRWSNYLAGTRPVTGTYRETNYDEGEDVSTGLLTDQRGRRIETGFRFARSIICPSLAVLPSDGGYGRFYLNRETGDIVHFEPLRVRRR